MHNGVATFGVAVTAKSVGSETASKGSSTWVAACGLAACRCFDVTEKPGSGPTLESATNA